MNETRQLKLIEPDIPDRLGPMIVSVAIVGLALGYLYFSEQGRSARERVGRFLERFAGDLERLRETVHSMAAVSLDELDNVERKILEFAKLARR